MNLRAHHLASVALSTLALATTGCMIEPESGGDDVADDVAVDAPARGHMRMTPIRGLGEASPLNETTLATTSPSGAKLVDYGGPVLTNVEVVPVFWNLNVQYWQELLSFYDAFADSEMYDVLSQYGVGHGALGGMYMSNDWSSSVSDSAVQSALRTMFANGTLPTPNGNTYYPVHFPPGVTVTDSDGKSSCTTWCAYHDTFTYNGVKVAYGIIPDQGGGCAGGCGSNSQRLNNLTSVSSHEMVEATTDPGVGLATSYSSPLAWYDKTNGEVGDICNAQQATIIGADGSAYVVQREFSNSDNNCVWGEYVDKTVSMNGTCYSTGTILMQNEMVTLIFQGDGNLVLYRTNGSTSKAVWATGTNGKSATSVCTQGDGNLVVYSSSKALWASNSNGSGATTLKLQTDCNLVLYTSSGTAKWASGTNGC